MLPIKCSHHPLARTSAAPLATEADDEKANGDEGRYDEMMMMKIRTSLPLLGLRADDDDWMNDDISIAVPTAPEV